MTKKGGFRTRIRPRIRSTNGYVPHVTSPSPTINLVSRVLGVAADWARFLTFCVIGFRAHLVHARPVSLVPLASVLGACSRASLLVAAFLMGLLFADE